MSFFHKKHILVIAPHPDDEVFGAGGLIIRALREGAEIHVLFITVGNTHDFSQNGFSSREERESEARKVAKLLGYSSFCFAFPGDEYHLQLDSMPQKKLINEIERGSRVCLKTIKPDILVAPSGNDYNQDHLAVNKAVIAATRPSPNHYKHFQKILLLYDPPCIWSHEPKTCINNFYIEISKEDVDKKIKAVGLYKSQLKDPNSPYSKRSAETKAAQAGLAIGKLYGEGFSIKRFVV